MSVLGDAYNAVKDGDTSDLNFWLAIIVLAIVLSILICLIRACFLFRSCSKDRQLKKDTKNNEQPEDSRIGDAVPAHPDARVAVQVQPKPPRAPVSHQLAGNVPPPHPHYTQHQALPPADPYYGQAASQPYYQSHPHHPDFQPHTAPQFPPPPPVYNAVPPQHPHHFQHANLPPPHPNRDGSFHSSHGTHSEFSQQEHYHLPHGSHVPNRHEEIQPVHHGRGSTHGDSGFGAQHSRGSRSPSVAAASPTTSGRGTTRGTTRAGGSQHDQFSDRAVQAPLPVSPKVYNPPSHPHTSSAAPTNSYMPPASVGAYSSEPQQHAVPPHAPPPPPQPHVQFEPQNQSYTRSSPTAAGSPAFLAMNNPALHIENAPSGLSASQGFQLEGEIMMNDRSNGIAQDSIASTLASRTHGSLRGTSTIDRQPVGDIRAIAAMKRSQLGGREKTLTLHLGLSGMRHSHPKFAEHATEAGTDDLSMRLFDMGLRFWTLKRRQPAQYAIIRKLHNLSAPFTKEAIDIDVEEDEVPHEILENEMTVSGYEEVMYVDIALQTGIWLEVQVEMAAEGTPLWVRLVMVEGSVVVLPQLTTFRMRMPGPGIVGLLRGKMPALA